MWEHYFNTFYTSSVFYMTHTVGHFSPVAAESAKVCVIIKLSRSDQPYRSDKIKNLYHDITFELQEICYWGILSGGILLYLTAGLAFCGEDDINSIYCSYKDKLCWPKLLMPCLILYKFKIFLHYRSCLCTQSWYK